MSRALLQQALDVIEREIKDDSKIDCRTDAVIDAIREALDAPQAKPEYWQWRRKAHPWSVNLIFHSQSFATSYDSEVRALYAAPPAQVDPVAWKHDCAGLCTNDVELWIDACPHCGKPRALASPPAAQPVQPAVPESITPKDAGYFYNLVMHALMDVGAAHGGCRHRLEDICKELESLAQPVQPSPVPEADCGNIAQPAVPCDADTLRRVASELRRYSPQGDEYHGQHVHKYWSDEIARAIGVGIKGESHE